MNVLLVHNSYQQRGGEDAAVEAQEQALRRAGISVRRWGRQSTAIERWSMVRKARIPLDTVFSLATYREVRSIARREAISVAHVHNVFPLVSPSVYLALADAGVPIVQTLHNYRLMCPNGLFYTEGHICERCKGGGMWPAVRGRCFRNSVVMSAMYAASVGLHRALGTFQRIERFIALTPFARDKVIEAGLAPGSKIRVLGNFMLEPLPHPDGIGGIRGGFCFLGRLSEEKGLGVLCRAARLVPSVPVQIAGEGPLRDTLDKQPNEGGSITLVGRVEGEAKWQLLRDSLALVVPSICYEMFPLVVLEAFAVGTPVIASNHGGLADLVEDGVTGLLFEPGNAEDLAEKMERLANDPELAYHMGQRGREVLLERYTEKAFVEQLLGIYEEVTAR